MNFGLGTFISVNLGHILLSDRALMHIMLCSFHLHRLHRQFAQNVKQVITIAKRTFCFITPPNWYRRSSYLWPGKV
jgi:hypothetical protein